MVPVVNVASYSNEMTITEKGAPTRRTCKINCIIELTTLEYREIH